MRLLRLNGIDVDIDEKTAIGITFQAYDFKAPGKRKINISNSFTIPLTSNNQKIIGFANNVQTTSNAIYDVFSCDYWIDNKHLIIDAKIRIEEITHDRIKLFTVQKSDFWEKIKDFKWRDFLAEYEEWLITKGEYFLGYGTSNWFTGTIQEFMANQKSGDRLLIPMYLGNLYKYEPGGEGTGFLETETDIYLTYGGNGGHLCTYVKSIFEFIEYKYDVDFLTSSSDPTIIWNDTYISQLYIPIRDYQIVSNVGGDWAWHTIYGNNFPPYEVGAHPDKTIYDLVNSFMQLPNIINDEKVIEGITTIKMRRFDDIKDDAEVIDFSNRLDLTKTKFKPKIPGYKQINRIKYASLYPDAKDDNTGAKEIICNNKNLDEVQDLFEIDAYFPDVVLATYGDYLVNMSAEESFETFTFLISNGFTNSLIEMHHGSDSTSQTLELAAIYGISGEYNFMEEIIAYPKFYEIQKWLTISDIINLEFFKQYHVKQLNGSFFINKISGFNTEKSNKPTKIELIRISDKTPVPEYAMDYFVDGFEDAFVDGTGDYFI